MSCAREKPHRNVGEKNQDARLEGKTVGSERALIEPRLLMRLVQDEEEHARADQREVEEHEERVGDALARVVAALRRRNLRSFVGDCAARRGTGGRCVGSHARSALPSRARRRAMRR